MTMQPIILTARRGNWRRFVSRRNNKRFEAIKAHVHKRDNNTCRYCQFQSDAYNEVVNLDHDYTHNKPDNLVTACAFCMQCFLVDGVGTDATTGGVVIHLPEISQVDLNNFCRVLFCSMDKESAYKSKLQSIYLSLKDRAKAVEDCFGPDSSQPQIFGQGLIDGGLTDVQLQHDLLKEVRLLPTKKVFKAQIDHWKKTVFAKVPL